MRFLPKEAWRYSLLLIVLFAIASIAVWQTIDFLGDHLAGPQSRIASILIWSLTLGFMLIAGAFGLWAIQFSAEGESRRRIGRLVDAMYYLDDGLLAVDRKGNVKGSNPAIKSMCGVPDTYRGPLRALFPCLSEDEVLALVTATAAHEVEKDAVRTDGVKALRFRSQPAEGLALVLVSDVTSMNRQRIRRRQTARLQLVGELARAIASDFNSLLCGIAGCASLLARQLRAAPDSEPSIAAIAAAARRGVSLAEHLTQLAAVPAGSSETEAVSEHVQAAAESLRNALPETWRVETDTPEDLGLVAIHGVQIEQTLLNLGLSATGGAAAGTIGLRASQPPAPATPDQPRYAVTISILACPGSLGIPPDWAMGERRAETGVIVSVIRTLLDGAGGALECFADDEGRRGYSVNLPQGEIPPADTSEVPSELREYIAQWAVLCAGYRRESGLVDTELRRLGIDASHTRDITSTLARIEEDARLDALIIHERLLGHEPVALVRAMTKIRPSMGMVVLTEGQESAPVALADDVVFVPLRAAVQHLVRALIESRGMAARRTRK